MRSQKSCQHLASRKGASERYFLMNNHQCEFLIRRLEETLAQIPQSSLDEKTVPVVLQELHHALINAQRPVQSSCITTSECLRAAIEQVDMKELFHNYSRTFNGMHLFFKALLWKTLQNILAPCHLN